MAGDGWWQRRSGQVVPPGGVADHRQGFLARARALPRWLQLVVGAALFLFVWYGLIGTLRAGIRPDPALRPTAQQLPAGGSVTVAMAARLIEREVDENSFTPNDPFFFPTGFARRTPAYQAGLIETVQTTVDALAERSPGPELLAASKALATPAGQWWLQAGWPPIVASAERQFRRAGTALVAYNQGLTDAKRTGPTPLSEKGLDDASTAALAALVASVDAQAMAGDRMIRGEDAGNASVQLASARGTAFAAAMLMRGLRDDNAAAIRLSGRAARWGEALDALDAAAAISPIVTRQGDLVAIGYSLLIAATAMRDILQEGG